MNNIDEDPRMELDSVQQGGSVSSTLKDAVTQSVSIEGNDCSLDDNTVNREKDARFKYGTRQSTLLYRP